MDQGRRKQNNDVFPEEDRSRPVIAGLLALTKAMFLVPCAIISFSYQTNPILKPTALLILWGTLGVAFILVPLALELKNCRGCSAKYAFGEDFVQVRIGRTVCSLTARDDVRICVKTLRLGYKNAPIEKHYYMLWNAGAAIPKDVSSPFLIMKHYDVLLLPQNETVRAQLCARFGKRTELTQDAEHDMGYVFSGEEQGQYMFIKGSLQAFHLSIPALLFVLLMNDRGGNRLTGRMILLCAVYLVVLFLQAISADRKHRAFARYRFSENAVSMWLGENQRTIHISESFQIYYRTFLFSGGKGAVREKRFIVLWSGSEQPPKDEVGAYSLMEREEVILLPDTVDVRNQLQKTLGVTAIGYWMPKTEE